MSRTVIKINAIEIEVNIPFHLFKARELEIKKMFENNYLFFVLTPDKISDFKKKVMELFAQDIRKEKLCKLNNI